MTSPHNVATIGSFPRNQILGIGRTGLTVRQGHFAIKLPLRWSTSSDEEIEANIEFLQHEQAVYTRLGKCDGVVPFFDSSDTSTTLAVMENGDLRSYLSRNKPSQSLQLTWFRVIARTLASIHERRIIVADIASRNLLLDSGLSIKFCDFTESTIMPLDTCMETADDGGYSAQTDIGQLGAVVYEVVVGKKCDSDIFKNVPEEVDRGIWPRGGRSPQYAGYLARIHNQQMLEEGRVQQCP